MRTITLTVDQPRFFDEVSKYGLINSTCPIGSRVIACLLGGVDWREAMGLGVYGVDVAEEAPAPGATASTTPETGTEKVAAQVAGEGSREELNTRTLSLEAALTAAEGEIERLRDRLESNFVFDSFGGRVDVPHGSIPDGIECRDETIKLLDERVSALALRATASEARAARLETMLARRDAFLVQRGLWFDFVDTLPEPAKPEAAALAPPTTSKPEGE